MMQAVSIHVNALQKTFGLTEQEAKTIIEEYPNAETPPLFKMIDTIMRRNHRDWTIISNTINIFQGQTLINGQATADKVGLSRERVRQLRNKLYYSICNFIRIWSNTKGEYDFSRYLNYCRMEYNDLHLDQLNKDEKVYFNSNFIYRVLSLFFHEQYILVGNDIRAFTEDYNKGFNIFIVPKELSDIFNFTAMLNDLRLKLNSKVYEDYSIELNQYLLRFFYDDIFFDKKPELLELCGKIIHRTFGVVAINDTLVIEKNATKPIPEILEEILSEHGEAMSLDEIYEQFIARYPDYSRDKDSLRGNIGRNSNIVPVSRTSSYVLKEWEKKGIKGGTIRDIIFDYLVSQDNPLSIDVITNYVLLFREGTNEKSVYSNMFADNAKRFSAFECNGMRLYGLSQKSYGDQYVLIEEEKLTSRRDFHESIELLERFIKEHDRFPFSSSDDSDEMRLNRFWGLHKARREKGELTHEQLSEMARVEELYGDKEYSKKDFLAMQQSKIASMRSTLFSMGIDPDM
jgi:Fe2+ or Zn2+ uptake regulation protein